jgi:Tfp pilus assembly protein FimT
MRLDQNCKMAFAKNGTSGISLLELCVVVLIIGLLSASAIPSIKPLLEDIRLKTTANAIKHQLYMARSRSLGDPLVHCGVVFDTLNKPNTVQTFIDDGVPVGNNQYDPGSDHLFLSAYTLPRTLKLQIGGAVHTNVVIFRGDGSAKIPGLTLTITNSLNKTKHVSVLPSTGRIKLF